MARISVILTIAALMALSTTVFAHSGGLDRNGGHYDRSNGSYHYHR